MKSIPEVLGESNIDVTEALHHLRRERVLVTGAAGAIGRHLTRDLREAGVRVIPTDIVTTQPWGCTYMDITNFQSVLQVVAFHEPTLILHLAAAKDAPTGEQYPWDAARTNVNGTQNILNMGKRVVFTSTCKAIEPQTAYGASKLLGERMVLNAGGSVARLVNVPECGPNVIDIWKAVPEHDPLPVTDCIRYMITRKEAIALILWSAALMQGRYKVDSGQPLHVPEFAHDLFPGRSLKFIPRRRGDRMVEPLCGDHEVVIDTRIKGIQEVRSPHD